MYVVEDLLAANPHGKMPSSGTCASVLAIASPTRRITPVSLPAVKTHALAEVAADTSPRSKACCSCAESEKSCAPPVTVMRTSASW